MGNAQEWGYAPIQLVTQDDANKKDKVDTFHIVDMLQQMHHGEHYIGSGFSIQDAITNLWTEGGTVSLQRTNCINWIGMG